MTDNDTATKRRDEQPNATMPGRIGRGPRRWSTPAIVAGAFACAIALGAGGYAAIAATDPTGLRQGLRLVFVQQVIGRALDSVGASAEQENKVHDIVAAKFAEIAPDPEEHGALRRRALELLGAPTVDRAEIEKLRAQAIRTLDAKSKAVIGGLLDIADQLTPDQRAKLAGEIEAMPQRGPMMGPWGGWRHGGSMFGAPDSGAN